MLDYDPFSLHVRRDPYPIYRRLRDEAPAYYLPKYDAWALSRFQDVWDASSDADSYSTAKGTTPAQVLTKEQPVTPMLNVMDPPEHTRLRAVIRKCFLPRHLRGLQPLVKQTFDGLLDEVVDQGSCDVVQDLGARLSVQVACLAIGIAPEEGPTLNAMVKRFFAHDPDTGGMTPDGLQALADLTAFCEDLIRRRRRQPGDGPEAADALIRFRDAEGRGFPDEVAASHVTMLVIGGSETFPKTLANGILRLYEHPDQRRALAQGRIETPAAYEEILRYDMPTQFLCRTLKRDVTLHEQQMREGQAVMFLYASANHDDREFERPEEFDIERRFLRHLSFSAGTHACLGTHVARMEGRITLDGILSRMPEYEVDLGGAVRLRTEFVQGFSRLPIRF